ncbi:insulinase family protein [Duganella sp. LX20W]|uniref:Insulinase family protein n=2 Tax=Rugamonas brunnea TaxID=2758569 RepID=A0A7W2ENG6_9BURK|nr:insulinase family protein [Rugamonas brunnea]
MIPPTLRAAIAAALLACAALAQADASALALSDTLPIGPQVKVGKLANGLTYYIQKNARPAQKLELRLVVKAGSMLEDEDQQGLAHFTEHMAFNGSTHFKRNELVSYLQGIGVKFGADLNAYTSFDETVYILPIPTERPEVVEQGFQVLEDWAHGLSFNDADIDSERGIVLEELRLGKGLEDRMNKVLMPKLMNGSRYAQRMPIGKEDVIKSFRPEAIRRFYHDWYRPDLMAVVVVGDVDPAVAQRMVERHFGALANPAHERPRDYAVIPQRQASEGVVVTDKEANTNGVYIRYGIEPEPAHHTVGDYRASLVEGLYGAMLGQRMAELTQQADPPFIQGGSSMTKVARGYRSFRAAAVLGKGGAAPAIAALVREDERARQFGFTEAELERAKKNMLRAVERGYNERDKSNSSGYAAEYIRNFLEQEPIPGIANEYDYVRQLVPGITLAEVNAAARATIPSGGNKLVIYTGSDRAEAPIPSQAELLAAVEAAERTPVQPQAEKQVASVLMAQPPKGGAIVSQSVDPVLGLTRLTLGNGVKVVLKSTDFNNDQVLMSAVRFGGQSLFGEPDLANARYASAIVAQMGLQDYSPADLSKVLAGKVAMTGATVGNLSETLSGQSGKADVETMLQLTYLQMTAPRRDRAIFDAFVGKQKELARNSLSRPEAVFGDTIVGTLYDNNARVARAPRPEDFDRIDLDRVFEIYRSRLSSARDFTFFIVGSFDVEQIKPLVAAYLGALPTPPVPVQYKDWGVRPVKGVVKKEVRMGAEPKSTISITFTGTADYSDDEQMRLQALLEALNIKLLEVLREQQGLIYGGGMSGALTKVPYGGYAISINLPCGPENVDKVIAATFAEIAKVKEQGVSQQDLDKVRASWSRNYHKGLRENGYWLGQLQAALINGTDPAALLTVEQRAAAIRPADLKQTARRYFDMDNYLQVVLYPASTLAP